MSALTTDRIRTSATKLGLTHLAETITQLVARAEHTQMGYLDFVDLLLQEETGLRDSRQFTIALKSSGLPHHKTLDEFGFVFQPDLDTPKIRDLATPELVRAKSNLVLLGPPGVGKTMLAVAACQGGFTIYFTILDDLVSKLRAAEPRPVQPATRRLPPAFSPTTSSPPRSSTGSSTTAMSCLSTAPATASTTATPSSETTGLTSHFAPNTPPNSSNSSTSGWQPTTSNHPWEQ